MPGETGWYDRKTLACGQQHQRKELLLLAAPCTSERMDAIGGQLSLFSEAEALANPSAEESPIGEVVEHYRRKMGFSPREGSLWTTTSTGVTSHWVQAVTGALYAF